MARCAPAWNAPTPRYLPPINVHGPQTPASALIPLLFSCSGLLALDYQVIRGRLMMHLFGSTTLVFGSVRAGLMAGAAVVPMTFSYMKPDLQLATISCACR
jgi:hypothetical protein